jgi:hypothetical protein
LGPASTRMRRELSLTRSARLRPSGRPWSLRVAWCHTAEQRNHQEPCDQHRGIPDQADEGDAVRHPQPPICARQHVR